MDIKFGTFNPIEDSESTQLKERILVLEKHANSQIRKLKDHASSLESENEMLKLQMIDNERSMNLEKSEIMSTCSGQVTRMRQELKQMEEKLECRIREETNMKSTMDELREELKKKWQKVPAKRDNKNEAKLLEDEKALTEALSEKLKIAEQRLAETQTTVNSLQREAQKILALRAILIAELNEQYEAGRLHGYKAFARRAYDFLGRFREGMIDDLISK